MEFASLVNHYSLCYTNSMKKKRIPYAVSNLEQIRNESYYFVDKTEYLEKLENYMTPVFLRPRRFGKTLWCSVQECYYDINRKDKFRELFGDTYIGKNPTPEQGKYMVLRLNFSSVQVSEDKKKIEHNFNFITGAAFGLFCNYYKNLLTSFTFDENESTTNKLTALFRYIQENNLPQIYLIIDEYDNFTNQLITSNNDILYKNLTSDNSFLKTFFRSTFYELCRRHLSHQFAFEIEINRHSGRADWELLGKPTGSYKNIKYLAEFKHFSAKDKKVFEGLKAARPEDVEQIKKYGNEIQNEFPSYTLTNWLIYTFSGRDWKVFKG